VDQSISFPYRGGTGSLVVPLVVNTITFPGGDVEGVGNLEYRIPIVGPVSATLFVDAGTTGILNKGALKLDPTGVANINSQFPLLNQPAQLQIAPGTNFHLRASTGIEFNINLPIVQAPFRIYWAYNPIRFHETITAPYDSINMNNLFLQCQALGLVDPLKPKSCDPIILTPLSPYLVNPGRLNYFEPWQTFRFTVSRTF
jgi:Omp85 superfamily domain